MKQWKLVALLVGILVLGAAALARLGGTVEGLSVGKKAPDFQAVDLASGDTVSLRERYQGYVTLLNIWATWCGPCRVEMPSMEQAYQSLAPEGFRIAAVSIDEGNSEDVRAFGQDLGLSFDLPERTNVLGVALIDA
ncbi:MAG TPA: TlpA disulfide reductase family protein, partial [Gemmatimonadales bacterium]|nr:TlpA disulfide reductase family protein [Gemmatimonadales bacterium]